MRKIIYMLLLTVVCGLGVTACTEEPVTPRTEENPDSGGGGSADPLKP